MRPLLAICLLVQFALVLATVLSPSSLVHDLGTTSSAIANALTIELHGEVKITLSFGGFIAIGLFIWTVLSFGGNKRISQKRLQTIRTEAKHGGQKRELSDEKFSTFVWSAN